MVIEQDVYLAYVRLEVCEGSREGVSVRCRVQVSNVDRVDVTAGLGLEVSGSVALRIVLALHALIATVTTTMTTATAADVATIRARTEGRSTAHVAIATASATSVTSTSATRRIAEVSRILLLETTAVSTA